MGCSPFILGGTDGIIDRWKNSKQLLYNERTVPGPAKLCSFTCVTVVEKGLGCTLQTALSLYLVGRWVQPLPSFSLPIGFSMQSHPCGTLLEYFEWWTVLLSLQRQMGEIMITYFFLPLNACFMFSFLLLTNIRKKHAVASRFWALQLV